MLKKYLPVCLNLESKKVLIIGAGNVACQKLKTLLSCGARVTVIAPQAALPIQRWSLAKKIILKPRRFKACDIHSYQVVYACTNDSKLNQSIRQLAKEQRILCNITDNPKGSDFISPAVLKKKNILIAVSSFGRNPRQSVRIRNQIKAMSNRHGSFFK